MSIRATFHYFQGMECDMYSFYRIPKLLFTSEYFKNLSCEAKVLYGLMLDRMSLSIKNRWFDEEDRAYIFFSVEEIMEILCYDYQDTGYRLSERNHSTTGICSKCNGNKCKTGSK